MIINWHLRVDGTSSEGFCSRELYASRNSYSRTLASIPAQRSLGGEVGHRRGLSPIVLSWMISGGCFLVSRIYFDKHAFLGGVYVLSRPIGLKTSIPTVAIGRCPGEETMDADWDEVKTLSRTCETRTHELQLQKISRSQAIAGRPRPLSTTWRDRISSTSHHDRFRHMSRASLDWQRPGMVSTQASSWACTGPSDNQSRRDASSHFTAANSSGTPHLGYTLPAMDLYGSFSLPTRASSPWALGLCTWHGAGGRQYGTYGTCG